MNLKLKRIFNNSEKISLFLLFFLLCTGTLSANEKTITWIKVDFPPVFINGSVNTNKGVMDCILERFIENMPEYRHKIVFANVSRIQDLMKKGENICFIASFKTKEREEYSCFSIPETISFPNMLITRSDFHNKVIGNKEEISLEWLIKKGYTGGVTKQRAYGLKIDETLKKYQNNKNLIFRSGSSGLEGLLNMLDEQRIDFTIGSPWELVQAQKNMKIEKQFSIIKITDSLNTWNKIYAACPKTPWGKNFIIRLNKIINTEKSKPEYLNCQTRWYPDSVVEKFREKYKKQILTAN